MADNKRKLAAEQRLITDKKSITLEDMKAYVEEFYPNEKLWLYKLATVPVPVLNEKKEVVKDEQGNIKTALNSHMTIKKAFFDKFLPHAGELSARRKVFVDWDIDELEKALTEENK